MRRIWRRWITLGREQRGTTAFEYGLITAIIGAVVLVGVEGLGSALTSSYTNIGGALSSEVAAI